MRLPARLLTPLVALGALFALGGGVALGMTLGERASRPGHAQLVIQDPALATGGTEPVLRSAAGFTGFDGPGSLGGAAVRAGTVTPGRDGAFEVTSPGSSLGVRTTSAARLFQLRRASAPLAAGDAVVVRTGADGTVTGVLRVPRDLNEGTGRPTPTPTPTGTRATGTPASAPAATGTPTR